MRKCLCFKGNGDFRFCGAAFKCLVRGFIRFTYDWSTTLWPEVYEIDVVRWFYFADI